MGLRAGTSLAEVPEWAAYAQTTITWTVTSYFRPTFSSAALSVDGTPVMLIFPGGAGSGTVVGDWQAVTPGGIIGRQVELDVSAFSRPSDLAGGDLSVQFTAEFAATPEPSEVALFSAALGGLVLLWKARQKSV